MHSPARCPATTVSPSRAPFVVMAQRGSPVRPRGRAAGRRAILRTEAAVSGISQKAAAASSLWRHAVLEALDSAFASCNWECAVEVPSQSQAPNSLLHTTCSIVAHLVRMALSLRKQRWYEPKSQTYARLPVMLGRCLQPGPATALFKTMLSEERITPTVDVYTALVGAYGYSRMLDEVLATVDRMKGAAASCKPDEYTFSVLINCCCKSRRFDLVPAVLDEMAYLGLGCNVVIHNGIIDGYGKAGMLEEMADVLSNMLEGGENVPDIYTMKSIICAYGTRGSMEDPGHDEFQLMGVEPDTRTFNVMIKSYSKANMPDKMMSVLKYMKRRFFSPSAATYNIIIECFGRAGNIEKMEYYFRLMKIQGIKPTPITYCSLVNGYSKAGLLDMVPGIIRQTENTDVVLDTPFSNCVISAYAKFGDIKIMEEMLQLMKDTRNISLAK